MKYFYTFFIVFFFTGLIKAQHSRKIDVAIKVAPSLNWFLGSKSKMIKPNGNIIGWSGGIEFIKNYTNISLKSGVLYEISGGKVKYNSYGSVFIGNSDELHMSYFYSTTENEILDNESYFTNRQNKSSGAYPNLRFYQLDERTFYVHYFTIPLLVSFNEKLPLNLSGIIGFNCSYLLNAYSNDKVTSIDQDYRGDYLGKTSELNHINVKKEINPFNLKLNIGISKSIALSKKISFCYGLNYLLGVTNSLKKNSTEIRYFKFVSNTQEVTGGRLEQKLNINSIELNLELVW